MYQKQQKTNVTKDVTHCETESKWSRVLCASHIRHWSVRLVVAVTPMAEDAYDCRNVEQVHDSEGYSGHSR